MRVKCGTYEHFYKLETLPKRFYRSSKAKKTSIMSSREGYNNSEKASKRQNFTKSITTSF